MYQDPVIFSGTIRSNLDPFGQHGRTGKGELADEAIWEALRRAGIETFVKDLEVRQSCASGSGAGKQERLVSSLQPSLCGCVCALTDRDAHSPRKPQMNATGTMTCCSAS